MLAGSKVERLSSSENKDPTPSNGTPQEHVPVRVRQVIKPSYSTPAFEISDLAAVSHLHTHMHIDHQNSVHEWQSSRDLRDTFSGMKWWGHIRLTIPTSLDSAQVFELWKHVQIAKSAVRNSIKFQTWTFGEKEIIKGYQVMIKEIRVLSS